MLKNTPRHPRGFTLVELLVVIAIIALLISILLPSLARAREQAKKAKCLANLKDIASASNSYSTEDPNEELVPRWAGVSFVGVGAGAAQWIGGALNEYNWGGKGGNPDLWSGTDREIHYFTQKNGPKTPNGPGGRLLNKFLYPTITNANDDDQDVAVQKDAGIDLPAYHCPSDVGVSPSTDGKDLVEMFTLGQMLQGNMSTEVPMYDSIGNSYKAHFIMVGFVGSPPAGMFPPDAEVPSRFGVSAAQRPYSQITRTSRVVVYSEGNSLWTHGWNHEVWGGGTDQQFAQGWHGEKQIFTASFADGHAGVMDQNVRMRRPTGIDGAGFAYSEQWRVQGSRPEFELMPVLNAYTLRDLLLRGDNWQLDAFPAPLAPVYWFDGSGAP